MNSFITSIFTSRSASSRLSRVFSFSNSCSRFTSGSAIEPYLRFQASYVGWLAMINRCLRLLFPDSVTDLAALRFLKHYQVWV